VTADQVAADREATNRAAAEAVRLVAAMYAHELAGRRVTARQRALQARAERLARRWTRQQQGGGHR
jgi:hypothetical protein